MVESFGVNQKVSTKPTQHHIDGQPVAQEDIGGSTHWTARDHIGTPFLQTNSADSPYWFADYEPFGAVYSLRTSDAHQPLRRPGQEATLITGTSGPNGDSQLFHNGARWYLPHFGRYTEPDPSGLGNSLENPYAYTFVDPVDDADVDGQKVTFYTHPIPLFKNFGHAYLLLQPDNMDDFKNDRRFRAFGSCSPGVPPYSFTTISAEPTHFYSKLNSEPDADAMSARDNEQVVSPPQGMSDTAFIRALLNTDTF